MRFLMQIKMPHNEFNDAIRDGSAGSKLKRCIEEIKPEAVYFTEYGGQRGAIMIINVKDPSEIPKFSEPFFLMFNANVEFHIVMSPEDLARAGLDKLGKKWS